MATLSFPQANIYTDSITTWLGTTYALAGLPETGKKRLLVQGDVKGFDGALHNGLQVCKLSASNAAELRSRLSWLNPAALGRKTSFGFGDRLGLATPGHVASLRANDSNNRIAPVFAQQSVRENTRIGRTPQEVMDAAMWGIFQEGWRQPWGADADHIKEACDLDPFIAAGYTFYTLDPSDYVDGEAHKDSLEILQKKASLLPWERFGTDYDTMKTQYCETPLYLNDMNLVFDVETFLRALVKYGRAILHAAEIAAILDEKMTGLGYDLELSVDETETPTSINEHFFIANELQLRGVPMVSLAPRFVGKFQKGVDYMGDIDELGTELIKHMAILHHFDSYKISIHTGSDKFSIYDTINDYTQGYVHVKTAGTSFLEALRVVALHNPPLFRKVLDVAHEHFQKDRKTYFLDCQPQNVPTNDQIEDGQLPDLLEQFDSRQMLHVTFGSILDKCGDDLQAFLSNHEADYQAALETHFGRHLQPFC